MRRKRREFTLADRIAIVGRATDGSGKIFCEKCGAWCRKRADYEIDHVIPEGMRPAVDQLEKLKPADGQLLCQDCHDKKTDKDKGAIALAVRRQGYALGIARPGKKKMRSRPCKEREPYRPAIGQPRLARQGFIPAGGHR
ncbi:MAG TPA: HNH endonuclease signature motif containing protein [Pseudolabrys sp.]|nr:HNH endonuclease signature motif containing protein [Pseudolabrys sp.]